MIAEPILSAVLNNSSNKAGIKSALFTHLQSTHVSTPFNGEVHWIFTESVIGAGRQVNSYQGTIARAQEGP